MSSSSGPRVTVQRLDAVDSMTEQTNFLRIGTTGASTAPAGSGLQRNSLSRHHYGPTSPISPHSPRVGECWRTGQASSHGGWFRPSPTKIQAQRQQ